MIRLLLLRLYPARWRERYGDEFALVLADRPLGPFDVADVLLGALDAHLHLRGLGAASEHRKGFTMTLRIGGLAAILGGILLFIGLAGASAGQSEEIRGPGLALYLAGTVFVLVALIGLSAFQARSYPALVWAAFAVPAVGAIVSGIGAIGLATTEDEPFLGALSGWDVWMIGSLMLVIGSGLFALATWRVQTLSRRAAAVLGLSVVTMIAMIPILSGLAPGPGGIASLVAAAGVLFFCAGWVALGVSAIRTNGLPAPAGAVGT